MRLNVLFFTLFAAVLLGFSSCQNESELKAVGGMEYFPTKTGDIKYYEMREITWNSFLGTGTEVISEIRQEIKDPFVNSEGDTVLRVEWAKYDSAAGDYTVYKVFTISANQYNAQITEDNVTAIKLSFPIAKNKSWDGNLFNPDKGSKDYKYIKVSEPFYSPYNAYNETITVREAQEVTNTIRTISKKSVYAKDVGMVYHEDIDYELIAKVTPAGNDYVKEGKETFIILK